MTTEDDRNRIQRLLNAITLLERDVERQQAVQDQALERLRTAWANLKASWSQGDSEEAFALMEIDTLLGVNERGELFGEPTLWLVDDV